MRESTVLLSSRGRHYPRRRELDARATTAGTVALLAIPMPSEGIQVIMILVVNVFQLSSEFAGYYRH